MTNAFTPKTWQDGQAGGTPITSTEMNRIEAGVESADSRLDAVESRATSDNEWTGTQAFTNPTAFRVGSDLIVGRVDGNAGQRFRLTGVPGLDPEVMPYFEVVPTTLVGTDGGNAIAGYQLYRVGQGDQVNREFFFIESTGTTETFRLGIHASGTGQLRPLQFRMGSQNVFIIEADRNVTVVENRRFTFQGGDGTQEYPLILMRNGNISVQVRQYSDTASGPRLFLGKNRGKYGTDTPPASGDILGDLRAGTLNAGAETPGVLWRAVATQAWTLGTTHGAKAQILTNPQGGTALQIAAEFTDAATDGQTALLVRRNNAGTMTLDRVTVGAVDSGGTGFRVLRVAN